MTRKEFVTMAAVLLGGWIGIADAADLKVIKSQKAKDITIDLLSKSGQWEKGPNDFVVRFMKEKTPVDAGQVTLNTSMPMPGMAPMIAGAVLKPEGGVGRYRGSISFPDRGDRQVTVAWDGPAGKGSTKFTVPVR